MELWEVVMLVKGRDSEVRLVVGLVVLNACVVLGCVDPDVTDSDDVKDEVNEGEPPEVEALLGVDCVLLGADSVPLGVESMLLGAPELPIVEGKGPT
jgi:hypothetical protein